MALDFTKVVYTDDVTVIYAKNLNDIQDALDDCAYNGITDWAKIKQEVKDALSSYVWKRTKRSPMILPIIMEA